MQRRKVYILAGASGRRNNARWASEQPQDKQQLEMKAPAIFNQFMKRSFVVKHSSSCFLASRQTSNEQSIRRDVKSQEGGLGKDNSAWVEWLLMTHMKATISAELNQATDTRVGN